MLKNFLVCCSIVLISLLSCHCAVFFTTNSEYGIFAAISFPIDLPHRNVFLSYNFEANYYFAADWLPLPIMYGAIPPRDVYQARYSNNDCPNCTALSAAEQGEHKEVSPPHTQVVGNTTQSLRKTLLSRSDFYHILIDKFNRSGINGTSCLLRLICELNASELGDVNGLLGSIMRVIFAPSTSMKERHLDIYYDAEVQGRELDSCAKYEKDCDVSILDMISSPISDIFMELAKNIL